MGSLRLVGVRRRHDPHCAVEQATENADGVVGSNCGFFLENFLVVT